MTNLRVPPRTSLGDAPERGLVSPSEHPTEDLLQNRKHPGLGCSGLQLELLDRRRWRTRAELVAAIFEYIEHFYSPARRHSALDYLTPNEFEDLHSTHTQTALR